MLCHCIRAHSFAAHMVELDTQEKVLPYLKSHLTLLRGIQEQIYLQERQTPK